MLTIYACAVWHLVHARRDVLSAVHAMFLFFFCSLSLCLVMNQDLESAIKEAVEAAVAKALNNQGDRGSDSDFEEPVPKVKRLTVKRPQSYDSGLSSRAAK